MLPHAKIYFPEAITTMLWTYALKLFAEKINVLKVDDYGINTMKKFSGKTTEISLRNEHKQGCPVHVLDEILQENISGLPKC